MVLRCKTLIFHIFEKMKFGKKFENTLLTFNKQKNLY